MKTIKCTCNNTHIGILISEHNYFSPQKGNICTLCVRSENSKTCIKTLLHVKYNARGSSAISDSISIFSIYLVPTFFLECVRWWSTFKNLHLQKLTLTGMYNFHNYFTFESACLNYISKRKSVLKNYFSETILSHDLKIHRFLEDKYQ